MTGLSKFHTSARLARFPLVLFDYVELNSRLVLLDYNLCDILCLTLDSIKLSSKC